MLPMLKTLTEAKVHTVEQKANRVSGYTPSSDRILDMRAMNRKK